MAFASSLREGIGFLWKQGGACTARRPATAGCDAEKRPGILTQPRADRNLRSAITQSCARTITGLAIVAFGAGPCRGADALVLLVQPPSWAGEAATLDPGPFADLLGRAMGVEIHARVSDDTLSHWQAVRGAADYQLAFDEAHFADYRIRHHGFTAIARSAADARFAVVVRPRTLVTAPTDLVARTVAVPEPPSLAVARLLALFPQPVRAPRLVVLPTRQAALDLLARGDVAAALLAMNDDGQVAGGEVALVTDVSPGRALTVAASLSEPARRALVEALVGASQTPKGRRALAGMRLRAVVEAGDEQFEGNERLLRGTWGYR